MKIHCISNTISQATDLLTPHSIYDSRLYQVTDSEKKTYVDDTTYDVDTTYNADSTYGKKKDTSDNNNNSIFWTCVRGLE
jgi:hypothetical protein